MARQAAEQQVHAERRKQWNRDVEQRVGDARREEDVAPHRRVQLGTDEVDGKRIRGAREVVVLPERQPELRDIRRNLLAPREKDEGLIAANGVRWVHIGRRALRIPGLEIEEEISG